MEPRAAQNRRARMMTSLIGHTQATARAAAGTGSLCPAPVQRRGRIRLAMARPRQRFRYGPGHGTQRGHTDSGSPPRPRSSAGLIAAPPVLAAPTPARRCGHRRRPGGDGADHGTQPVPGRRRRSRPGAHPRHARGSPVHVGPGGRHRLRPARHPAGRGGRRSQARRDRAAGGHHLVLPAEAVELAGAGVRLHQAVPRGHRRGRGDLRRGREGRADGPEPRATRSRRSRS